MSTELEQLRAYVNNIKNKQKNYYTNHRDGFLKNQKTYYEKNKDKILKKKKEYYQKKKKAKEGVEQFIKSKKEEINNSKLIADAVSKVRNKTTKILSV
jgi:hypothetical protein